MNQEPVFLEQVGMALILSTQSASYRPLTWDLAQFFLPQRGFPDNLFSYTHKKRFLLLKKMCPLHNFYLLVGKLKFKRFW